MKGLILKEIYLYKGQMKIYIALFIFYTIYSIAMKNTSMLFMMVALLGVSGMLAGFSVDNQCKWDIYALSTPVGRRKSVLSKYGMGFIMISVITGITIISALMINVLTKELSFTEILFIGYGVFAVTIFITVLNVPFIYKLGVEKARYVYLLEMLIPTSLYLLLKEKGIPMPTEEMIEKIFLISPIVLVLLSVLSIYISIKIYEEMEF